jgi:hypothetical protein
MLVLHSRPPDYVFFWHHGIQLLLACAETSRLQGPETDMSPARTPMGDADEEMLSEDEDGIRRTPLSQGRYEVRGGETVTLSTCIMRATMICV